jgi:hypothetical protein
MMVESSSGTYPSSEKAVKEALKKYLKSIGAYYFMPVQMGYGSAGLDFFVCYQSRFYGIETKRPSKRKPTARQHFIMDEIARAGGGVWLENSTELEVTRARLEQ